MEGLFFVVDPIWWIAPLHLSSLIIALLTGVIVGLYILYRGRPRSSVPIHRSISYRFHPVSPIDPSYAEKLLIEIRKYLTYHYQPIHSWAHISRDIEKYSTDTRLIAIIEQLEHTVYSGKELTREEIESIQSELIGKLRI